MLCTRPCRHAHTCGLTYCTVGMPAARNRRANPRLNSGASMPTKTSGFARRNRRRIRARSVSRRGRSRRISNSPMTASDSDGSQSLATGRLHFGPATPKNRAPGASRSQRLDERRTERVARRLARHQTHPQRRRHAEEPPPAYRTMLRELRLMKSTKGRISGCAAAALSSSSSAAFNLSPDRYRRR